MAVTPLLSRIKKSPKRGILSRISARANWTARPVKMIRKRTARLFSLINQARPVRKMIPTMP
jgi:hypothetical protein